MNFHTYSPQKSAAIYKRTNGARLIGHIDPMMPSFSFALLHPRERLYTDFYGWFQTWEVSYFMARMNTGVEFVNIRLAQEDKPRVEAFIAEIQDDFADHLVNFVSSGYKVSINLDPANNCYIVAATGTKEARENKGLCMTTRSSEMFEALYMMLYKHEKVCDHGSWGEPVNQVSDWG